MWRQLKRGLWPSPKEVLATLGDGVPADLACPELWNSDEEYEQFLADLYASRCGVTGI
jgi:hypothetical protein